MSKTLIKGGLLGGIVIFIWMAISWMLIPWHMATLHSFTSETTVAQVMKENAPQSGIYMMPLQANANQQSSGPMVFAAVHQEGMTSMPEAMLIELVCQIVTAFLVTWMLMKTARLNYWGRVGFVFVFAITTSIASNVPYWTWFHFSTGFTLVSIADILISWLLAGLVIAKVVPEKM